MCRRRLRWLNGANGGKWYCIRDRSSPSPHRRRLLRVLTGLLLWQTTYTLTSNCNYSAPSTGLKENFTTEKILFSTHSHELTGYPGPRNCPYTSCLRCSSQNCC